MGSPSSHPHNSSYRQLKANKQAQAADRGNCSSLSCQRCEEEEARAPAEEQYSSATAEREELKPDFIIRSKNKGRDLKGKFTHRFHPSYLPLQAGNKVFKSSVIYRAVPVTDSRPAFDAKEHKGEQQKVHQRGERGSQN